MAQLQALFDANKTVGCGSMLVQFANQTTGEGFISYNWNFGNGTTSTLENPQVLFAESGVYTVTLIVSNQTESDTLIKKDLIRIHKSPEAKFTLLSEKIGCVGSDFEFTNHSQLGDTTLSQITWDFGDQTFSSDTNPTHAYHTMGIYTVSLYITDNNGCESSMTKVDLIQTINNPIAHFTAKNTISCKDTATVFFTNSSIGETALEMQWSFGDSEESTLINPSHFYNGYGNYSVTLKVTDDFGCSNTIAKQNMVQLQAINVAFSAVNDSLCTNQDLELKNESVGANSFEWTFGDDSVSTANEPKKSFQNGGNYSVRLVGSLLNYCSDTAYQNFWVDSISASFLTDKSYGCQLPFEVNYQNTSRHASSFLWNFGNGTSSNDENPMVIFTSTDSLLKEYKESYSDTLIATSKFGCVDTAFIPNNISIILPRIHFTPNDTSANKLQLTGCVPLIIEFENKSINNNPTETFTNVNWNFGDGNSATTEHTSYVYTIPGDYTIELAVTNSSNCVNTFKAKVAAGTPQSADFQITGSTNVCGSEPITFVDSSTDSELIDTWSWIFSDGGTSNKQNPTHVYTDTGFVSALLTVSYNGCKSEPVFKENLAHINGPAGTLLRKYSCENWLTYGFTSDIEGYDSIFWDFGDFTYNTSQSQVVSHTYSQTGNYDVKLFAKNDSTQCQLSLSYKAQPRHIISNVSFNFNSVCLDDSVLFDGSSSQDETFFVLNNKMGRYLWKIDNDTTIFALSAFHYNFPENGTYEINLKVSDLNGCSDDTTFKVSVFKPEAIFIADTNIGCSPLKIQTQDQSTSDTMLVKWNWYINENWIDSMQHANLIISDTGFHSVSLIVEDAIGCKDTMQLLNSFYTSRPQPAIKIPAKFNCQYDSLLFQNLSVGNIVENIWSFGDGQQSNLANPKHTYTDTGYFNIELYLVDSLGCDTSYHYPDSIYIEALPTPNFSFDITNPTCYPALVKFFDASAGAVKIWQWNFGDNTHNGSLQNPLHSYLKPGNFKATLNVTTQIGCKNKKPLNKEIQINGPFAQLNAPEQACIRTPYWFNLENGINIFSADWLFDDGSNYLTDSVEHLFETFGWHKFHALLKSDNFQTCDKVFVDSLYIPTLLAQFQVSDSVGCEPLEITTMDQSTGNSQQTWLLNTIAVSNEANAQINITESGFKQLTLLVKNEIGCLDSLSKTIEVFALPAINLSNDTIICINDTIELSASGGVIYQWQSNSWLLNSNSSKPLVFPKNPTQFIVQVTDTNQCIQSDSLWVDVQNIPLVDIITKDTLLIIGENLLLDASVMYAQNFKWEPGNMVDCDDCLSAWIQPEQSTTFYFTATDNYQCFSISDSIHIAVDIKFSLAMPSAFTPNNDGINDLVFVKGWGIKELISFQIYNKFGLLVFETTDLALGWDGKYKSSALAADLYYYKVEVLSFDNKQRTQTGEIYLLKQ